MTRPSPNSLGRGFIPRLEPAVLFPDFSVSLLRGMKLETANFCRYICGPETMSATLPVPPMGIGAGVGILWQPGGPFSAGRC